MSGAGADTKRTRDAGFGRICVHTDLKWVCVRALGQHFCVGVALSPPPTPTNPFLFRRPYHDQNAIPFIKLSS